MEIRFCRVSGEEALIDSYRRLLETGMFGRDDFSRPCILQRTIIIACFRAQGEDTPRHNHRSNASLRNPQYPTIPPPMKTSIDSPIEPEPVAL